MPFYIPVPSTDTATGTTKLPEDKVRIKFGFAGYGMQIWSHRPKYQVGWHTNSNNMKLIMIKDGWSSLICAFEAAYLLAQDAHLVREASHCAPFSV